MREALTPLSELLPEYISILEPAFGAQSAPEVKSILAEITGIHHLGLLTRCDDIFLSQSDAARMTDACRRRADNEPLPYITGKAYFMYDEFSVGEGVLIPRCDTECLVEQSVAAARSIYSHGDMTGRTIRFLEFCTGSGCISISFIRSARKAGLAIHGIASDISSTALGYAVRNASDLGVTDALDIIGHDLLSGDFHLFTANAEQYDIIICNPPYIRSAVIPTLDASVRDYEPHLALDGGADGLDFYRVLAGKASRLLSAGGCMLVEIGFDQADEVEHIFQKTGIFSKISVYRDYSGQTRIVAAELE
ncbi:MAG: peptide chain release factor N(5)-glutamine methyltransferase [Saccharofermentanales bacterium]